MICMRCRICVLGELGYGSMFSKAWGYAKEGKLVMLPLDRPLTDDELREALTKWFLSDRKTKERVALSSMEEMYAINIGSRIGGNYNHDDWIQFNRQNYTTFPRRAGEVINEWQNQNIVMPDPTSTMSNWYCLTVFGKQALETEEAIEVDPVGVLRRLTDEIPNIDSLTLDLFREAMSCFRNREHKASAVMMGVASENAIRLLGAALYSAAPSIPSGKRVKELRSDKVLTVRNAIVDAVKGWKLRTELPRLLQSRAYTWTPQDDSLLKDFDETIGVLFEHYRRTRNESGHPEPVEIDREMLKSHLINFRRYARVVFGMIMLLEK